MESKLANIEKIKLATNSQFSSEEIAIIKSTVAKNTTDIELTYFMSLAKTLNLNPFNKEIWCYKDGRGNLMSFAGRDGFLKIAQRNKLWNGIVSSEVRENDKFEVDIPKGEISHKPNFKDRGKIMFAYCYIKPKGCDIATIEIADFETYNKGYNVWKSHPADMIKKVAEIKALKKAFGIAGLYDENDFAVQNEKVIAIDTEHEVEANTYVYIEQLLSSSSYDEDDKCAIERELENGIYTVRADELISELKENQLAPMDRGNISQTEIKQELKSKVNDPKS